MSSVEDTSEPEYRSSFQMPAFSLSTEHRDSRSERCLESLEAAVYR
jgi:hypothetical protein